MFIQVTTDPGVTVTVNSVTGGGSAIPDGDSVRFTPPGTEGQSIVNYTLTNTAGSDSSTITIDVMNLTQGDPPTNATVLFSLPDPDPGGTPIISDTGEEAA